MIFPSNSHPISYLTSLSLPHPGHGQDPCHALVLADGPAASTLRSTLDFGRGDGVAAPLALGLPLRAVETAAATALSCAQRRFQVNLAGREMLGVREGVENSCFFCVCVFFFLSESCQVKILLSSEVAKTWKNPQDLQAPGILAQKPWKFHNVSQIPDQFCMQSSCFPRPVSVSRWFLNW